MSQVCEVWPLADDCPCDLPEGTDEDLIAYWQEVSSGLLFVGGGRRHGTCPVTVRPCLRRCGGGFGFSPYKGSDGEWRNLASCGCPDDCSCVSLSEIVLPGPVASVTEVLIDGETLDEADYRLDIVGSQYRLLRTDGGAWPSCSDITADCGDEGAFCVTYEQGIELDAVAIAANSELTCNLTKACLGLPCLLPKNVAAVTRRGVSIQFDTAKEWLYALPLVAAFLNGENPNQLSSESSVFSPDIPRTRVTPQATIS